MPVDVSRPRLYAVEDTAFAQLRKEPDACPGQDDTYARQGVGKARTGDRPTVSRRILYRGFQIADGRSGSGEYDLDRSAISILGGARSCRAIVGLARTNSIRSSFH
jgi:hypothetical protein